LELQAQPVTSSLQHHILLSYTLPFSFPTDHINGGNQEALGAATQETWQHEGSAAQWRFIIAFLARKLSPKPGQSLYVAAICCSCAYPI